MKEISNKEWEERNKEIMGYRKKDVKWSNRLYFFEDETIAHALKRKVQDFKESGIILVYSLRQPTGSGKTNSTFCTVQQISELNGYKFDWDKDLVFTGSEFLARLDEIQAGHPGSIIVWDEGGVGGGFSRAWRTQINWDIQEAVRMSRFLLPHIFIILPLLSLIDVDIRRLTNIELECFLTDQYERKSYGEFKTTVRGLNQWGQIYDIRQAPIKIHNIDSEDIEDKFEFVNRFTFDFIDEDLWENYEELKMNAFDKIKAERQAGAKEMKDRQNREAETKESKEELILTMHQEGMFPSQIASYLRIPKKDIEKIIKEGGESK